ncbi:hypothetical protein C8F01DRAFT_1254979 [Mycena amicta]|nr:hypothetical protein C8F01DRAFT_1254979 [Mycena amicta]
MPLYQHPELHKQDEPAGDISTERASRVSQVARLEDREEDAAASATLADEDLEEEHEQLESKAKALAKQLRGYADILDAQAEGGAYLWLKSMVRRDIGSDVAQAFEDIQRYKRADPSRIQIADISNTVYDPLARAVRRGLPLLGVYSGIPVVYSTEVPGDVKLLPLPEDEFAKGKVEELGVMDDWRVRVLPVLGPLPAVFGLHAATYVLAELAGKPILNPLAVKNRRKVYERRLRDLQAREGRRASGEPGMVTRLPIDRDDVALIFESKISTVEGQSYRHIRCPFSRRLCNPSEGLTLENVVVMEHKEATKHEAGGLR